MAAEREEVRAFFEKWNRESWLLGVRLEVIGDDTHAVAGAGRAQELIIKQTLELFRNSLVLFIGLLGQRFGTRTKIAGSGTEEEFKWALRHRREGQRSGKPFPEIMFYFRNRQFESPLDVAAIEAALEQYRKVDEFKRKVENGKLYYKEFGENQFRDVFGADVRLWLSHPDRPWLKPASELVPSSGSRKIKPDPVVVGKSFTETITDMKMLSVPEGRFQIGEGRKGVAPWVRLSSFWISETPVTNRQYAIFLKEKNYKEPEFWKDERYNDSQQPVVGVRWNDAVAFCTWLSTITGLKFSLCSEAQWEYGARGTDARTYPWGNDPPTSRLANYDRNLDRPASAGSYWYSHGPFGTLEQAGNVWEWCLDVFDPEAYEQWKDAEPLDPVTREGVEDRRVLRGACWIDPPGRLPSFTRFSQRVSYTANRVGFRVAMNLPDVK